MKYRQIVFLIFTAILASNCDSAQRPLEQASPLVRVLLYQGNQVVIKPHETFIFSMDSRKQVGTGTVRFSLVSNSMAVNGINVMAETVEISPSEYFDFNGHKYRGSAVVINTGKDLILMNVLDIESYLCGVLPAEVPSSWDYEALKAQAVVSRTYALYEVAYSRKNNRLYDVYSDTRSQVYAGMEDEDKFTSAAINNTVGEVVKFQGRIIKSYFHACSGGVTESAEQMFGEPAEYLVPVQSAYGKIYNNFKWQYSIGLNELGKVMGAKLSDAIAAINVTERTSSQRIKSLEIIDAKGNRITLGGNEFRMLIGATNMRSTRANIKIENGILTIEGVGYGHGVGMGQWDAQGMALKGFNYKNIVVHFYRGTRIEKVW